ncbi:MAG: hypothetical protein U1F68_08665 [Gammaproteobacteria bacterium]
MLFSYPAERSTPADNASVLAEQIADIDGDVLHFVAHSLGGLVVRHLLARFGDRLPWGRTVTLGTPHQRSQVASALHGGRLGFVLGKSVEAGLLGDVPPWPEQRDLGSIAGVYNLGLGRLVMRLSAPSDGAVSVAETMCPGMSDHICLPVSHTGMLFSAEVVEQTLAFLSHGQFLRSLL